MTPPGSHRAPEPDWVTVLAYALGGVLLTAMLSVTVWAAVFGEWMLMTFSVTMIGLVCWDEWMRWRRR